MEEQKYLDGQTIEVSLNDIELDENQPRKQIDADALKVLVQSIKEEGLIQNIAVRPIEGGKFKIVAGERRYRAFQELSKDDAKWERINAVVRLVDDQQALNLALLENIHREELLPIERANALVEYKERNGIKKNKELAAKVGMSPSNLSNLLKMRDFDKDIIEEISGENGGKYKYYELLRIVRNKPDVQKRLFNELKKKVTKAETEEIPLTDEERTLNSKRFFARVAAEVKSLNNQKGEAFEANKFNAARVVQNALECLEKLSKVKDAPALDLEQKYSIGEIKEALQVLIDKEPKPEPKPEPAPKPKKAKAAVKKAKKTDKTDK